MAWVGQAKVYRLRGDILSAALSLFGVLTFLGVFLITTYRAEAVNVDAGLDWVVSQQKNNGSWNNRVRDSIEILKVLKYFGRDKTVAFERGVSWMRAVPPENTDVLCRKIEVLTLVQPRPAELDQLANSLILQRRGGTANVFGGWGNRPGGLDDILSTYLAARTLLAAGYKGQSIIQRGFEPLIWYQRPNGAWMHSLAGGPYLYNFKESIYLTASIMNILMEDKYLADYISNYYFGTSRLRPIENARGWLLSRQNADGGWGENSANSSVDETVLVYFALLKAGGVADQSVFERAINFIKSKTAGDQWLSDPYLTAISLMAVNTGGNSIVSLVDVTLSEIDPTLGDEVRATVTVENRGSKEVPLFLANAKVNATAVVTGRSIVNLAAGQRDTFSFTFQAKPEGPGTLNVSIDTTAAATGIGIKSLSKPFTVVKPYDFSVTASGVQFVLPGGVSVLPADIQTGMKLRIRATVFNNTDKAASNVSVRFTLDDVVLGADVFADSIGAFTQSVVEMPWTVTAAEGTHNLFVRADPGLTFREINRNNNEAWVGITVKEVDLTPPVRPQGLTCSIDPDRLVSLSWASNLDGDLAGYMVFRNAQSVSLADVAASARYTANTGDLPAQLFGDLNPFTGWSAELTQGPAELLLEFLEPVPIAKFTLRWMDEARTASDYEISSFVNGAWKPLASVKDNVDLSSTAEFAQGESVTKLRIAVTRGASGSGPVGIGEISIRKFGAPEVVTAPSFREQIATLPAEYTVVALDRFGNQSEISPPCSIVDTTPPTAQIAFPASGQRVSDILEINGTATDIFLKNYTLRLTSIADSQSINIISSAKKVINGVLGEARFNELSPGSYVVTLTVEDVSGQKSETSVVVVNTGDVWVTRKIVSNELVNFIGFPAWSADQSEIVFTWDTRVFNAIWKTPPSGGSPEQVTINFAGDMDPAWKPVGGSRRLVFSSNTGSGLVQLFAQEVGDTIRTQITSGTVGFDRAEWSHDGTRLAAVGSDKQIYTMNADGSGRVRLTDTGLHDFPAWSPDGSQIIFQSPDPAGLSKIWLMAADGTNRRQLTTGPFNDFHPTFLSDGSRISYVSERSGRRELYLIDLASGAGSIRITDASLRVDYPRATHLAGTNKIAFSAPDGIYLAELIRLPEIQLTADTSFGVSPLAVRFTASVTNSEAITSYEWDFDGDGNSDGSSTLSADTTHAYSFQGRYTARLRVATSRNFTLLKFLSIDVRGPPLLVTTGLVDGAKFFTPVSPRIDIRDDNLKTFTLKLDGLPVVSGSPISSPGFHTIEAVADDFDGFVSTKKFNVIVTALSELEYLKFSTPFYATQQSVASTPVGWSPRGDSVVYSSNRQIFISDAKRMAPPVQVTFTEGDKSEPAWSPDGRKIAFMVTLSHSDRNIWVMNPDGSGQRKITTFGTAFPGGPSIEFPSWSPDSRYLIYVFAGDIYRIDVESLAVTTIYDQASHANHAVFGDIDWSGANNRIAAGLIEGDGARSFIGIINPDDPADVVEIQNVKPVLNPVWSPDGTYLAALEIAAFDRNVDGRLLNQNSSGGIVIFPVAGGSHVQVDKPGEFGNWPAWSRDGSRIAYIAFGDLKAAEVNPAPLITRFEPLETTVAAPVTVSFSCDAFDFMRGRIVRYEIDFEGDGVMDLVTDTCAGVSHAYASGGRFEPLLRVVDNQGALVERRTALTATGPPTVSVQGVEDKGSYFGFVSPDVFISDDNLTSRRIEVDGMSIASGTPVTETGPHVLFVQAVDASGNVVEKRLFFYVASGEALDVATLDVGNPFVGSPPQWLDSDTRILAQVSAGAKNALAVIDLRNPPAVQFLTLVGEDAFYPDVGSARQSVVYHQLFGDNPYFRLVERFFDTPAEFTQITNRITTAIEPSHSPARDRLVYVDAHDIHLLNRFTGNSKLLIASSGDDKQPRFSPDGTRIAFASDRGGNFDIYVYSFIDGRTVQITTDTADDLSPSWAADGARLIFHSFRGGRSQIYVADPAGRVPPASVFPSSQSDLFPSFSPAGAKVAFVSQGKLKVIRPRADFTPPIVKIDTPAAGGAVSFVTAVSVSSPDSDVARVALNVRLQRDPKYTTFDLVDVPPTDVRHQFNLALNTNLLPDGAYFLQAAAFDRFDNVGNDVIEAIVDNRTPRIDTIGFQVQSEFVVGEVQNIVRMSFHPSEESKIELNVKNSDGTVVKTIKTGFLFPRGGIPETILWDQRNSFGSIVVADTYAFEFRVIDRAGSQQSFTRDFRVPGLVQPVSSVSTSRTPVILQAGRVVQIFNAQNAKIYERAADDSVFVWNGRDRFGALTASGTYQAVTVDTMATIILELDTIPPSINTVSLAKPAFAPLAGQSASISYRTGEYAPSVLIAVHSPSNAIVREFSRKGSFSFNRSDTVLWDGIDRNNNFVSPGLYSVFIHATDAAGNKTSILAGSLTVDGPPRILDVAIETDAITPNGDFFDDSALISVRASEDGVALLQIYSSDKSLVHESSSAVESGVARLTWDGNDHGSAKSVPAGFYNVVIEITDRDGLKDRNDTRFIQVITIPAIGAPTVTAVTDFPDPFSPNGDALDDAVTVRFTVSETSVVTLSILNSAGQTVRTIEDTGRTGVVNLVWDGLTDAGEAAPNGLYAYRIEARGVKGLKSLPQDGKVLLFNPPVSPGPVINAFTVFPNPFSPNNDGKDEFTNISVSLSASGFISIDILSSDHIVRHVVVNDSASRGESVYTWDGKDDSGVTQGNGVYTVALNVVDVKGLKAASTGSVQIDTSDVNAAPVIGSLASSPAVLFSDGDTGRDSVTIRYTLSEDATVFVSLRSSFGQTVASNQFVNLAGSNSFGWNGAESPARLSPYGVYDFLISATDQFGFASETQTLHVPLRSIPPVIFDPVVDGQVIAPDGDGVLDTIGIRFLLSKAANFVVSIRNVQSGAVVETFAALGVKGENRITWTGATGTGARPDTGRYDFTVDATDTFGEAGIQIVGPTFRVKYPPVITAVSADPVSFSPNGDGSQDTVGLRIESDFRDFQASLKIYDTATNTLVQTFQARALTGGITFVWDGRSNGVVVDNGYYRFDAQVSDTEHPLLKSPVSSGTVRVNNPLVLSGVTQSASGFTPNANPNDGPDDVRIDFTLNFEAFVSASVFDAGAAKIADIVVNSFRTRGANSVTWNGLNSQAALVADGTYKIQLTVFDDDDRIDTHVFVLKLRTSPLAKITSPIHRSTVTGAVEISGFAASVEPFDQYEVLIGVEDTTQSPSQFFAVKKLSVSNPAQMVIDGPLAVWASPEFKNAEYFVRLNVVAGGGTKSAADSVIARADNPQELPFNVVAQTGKLSLASSAVVTGKLGWSLDGSQIVFEKDGKLYLINSNGSGLTAFGTDVGEPALSPAWSSDNRIVFHKANSGDSLFLKHLTGTTIDKIDIGQAVPIAGDVSPNGSKIVFSAIVGANNTEIFTVNSDGSALTRLTNNSFFDDHPVFSPDGTQIAFSSNRSGSFDIWIMNASTGQATQITSAPGNELFPSWSRDNRQVLYESHD